MLLCQPCEVWFLDVVQKCFLDSKTYQGHEPQRALGFKEQIVARCSHERKILDVVRGKYSCWFCCHLFIIINANSPGRLLTPSITVARFVSENENLVIPDGHGSNGRDLQGGREHEEDTTYTIYSILTQTVDSPPSLTIGCEDGPISDLENVISFDVLERFWTRSIQPRYDWSIKFGRGADGSRTARFKKGILSWRNEERMLRAQSLESSRWLSSTRLASITGWLNDCINEHTECTKGLSAARLRSLARRTGSKNEACDDGGDGAGRSNNKIRGRTPLDQGSAAAPVLVSARSLPKRLILIGDREEDIKLVESSSLDADTVEYAALSHCWGQTPYAVLTIENYDDYREVIRRSDLTKTFIDALTLCRSLRIAYIWVDSLCIIQNSPNDWISEAPRMHLVYGNSLLTIAALSASHGAAGIFRPPNQVLERMLRIKLPGWPVVGPALCSSQNYFARAEHNSSVLVRRGWCCQELYLSPRTLRWTDDQLIWHCDGRSCSDIPLSSSEKDRLDESLWAIEPGFFSWLGMRRIDIAAAKLWQIDREWSTIVRQFSDCSVTKPEDRYWALSGLAAHFHTVYTTKLAESATAATTTLYIAGMWKHNLTAALCWTRINAAKAVDATPPAIYAPSWSWLRVQGARVEIQERNSAEILHTQVDYENSDQPFGPLKSASLKMRTFVFEIAPYSTRVIVDRRGNLGADPFNPTGTCMDADKDEDTEPSIAAVFEAKNGSRLLWRPLSHDRVTMKLNLDDGHTAAYSSYGSSTNTAELFPPLTLPPPYENQRTSTGSNHTCSSSSPLHYFSSHSPYICALMSIDRDTYRVRIDALVLKCVDTNDPTRIRVASIANDKAKGDTGTDWAGPIKTYERIGILHFDTSGGRERQPRRQESQHSDPNMNDPNEDHTAVNNAHNNNGNEHDPAKELSDWFDSYRWARRSLVLV